MKQHSGVLRLASVPPLKYTRDLMGSSVSRRRALVLVLFGLSFGVRLYRLGDTEFWYDEAATYVIAIKGFIGNLEFARLSPWEHPPFYYWIVYAWMQLTGSTEFAIRFLSLGLGLLVVALVYQLARRELGEAMSLGVLGAAVVSPFLVTYSQEARNYSLLLVWVVLALQFFLAVVRRGHLRDMLLFGLVSLLGIFTHYFFALTFVGEFVFFALQGRSLNRRAALRWLTLMMVPGTALLIWMMISPGLRINLFGAVSGASDAPDWPYRLTQVIKDIAWPETIGTALSTPDRLLAVVSWVPVGFGVLYYDASRPNVVEFRRLLVATIVGTLLLIAVVHYNLLGRHVSVVYPSFLLLSIMGIAELYRRGRMHGILALLLVCPAVVGGLITQYTSTKGDYGAAAKVMHQSELPTDVVVSAQPSSWPIIDYYNRYSNVPILYFPGKPIFTSLDRPEMDPEPETLIRFLAPVSAAHQRIWIVTTGGRTDDPGRTLPRWLSETAFAAEAIYSRSTSFELFVNGTIEDSDSMAPADFGNQIRLQSATVNATKLKPGEPILTELQWVTRERIASDELPTLKLVDARGHVWAEQRVSPCGGFCLTSDWPINQIVRDRHALIIPVATPPGKYRVTLQLFHPPTRLLLNVKTSGVASSRDSLELATVTVVPDTQAVLMHVEHPLNAALGPGLELAGYDGAPTVVRADGAWPVSLLWKIQGPMADNASLEFHWLDERGGRISDVVLPLASGDYPVTAWQSGEIIRQNYDVPLPRGTRATILQIALNVRRNDIPAGLATILGQVGVIQIARNFSMQSGAHPTNATFGDGIALSGYDVVSTSRRKLSINLYWHAIKPIQTNYKVFVHLIAADESVKAQNDSEPVNGQRPTTGWEGGEYLKDEHLIGVPDGVAPGVYRIAIGLYESTSGQRLPVIMDNVEQENRRLVLTSVEVN